EHVSCWIEQNRVVVGSHFCSALDLQWTHAWPPCAPVTCEGVRCIRLQSRFFLQVRPGEPHCVPEVTPRTARSRSGPGRRPNFQIWLLPRLMRGPLWGLAAVGVTGARQPRPVADQLPLNGQIRFRRLVLAAPAKEERMLDRVGGAQGLIFERVGKE